MVRLVKLIDIAHFSHPTRELLNRTWNRDKRGGFHLPAGKVNWKISFRHILFRMVRVGSVNVQQHRNRSVFITIKWHMTVFVMLRSFSVIASSAQKVRNHNSYLIIQPRIFIYPCSPNPYKSKNENQYSIHDKRKNHQWLSNEIMSHDALKVWF